MDQWSKDVPKRPFVSINSNTFNENVNFKLPTK